MGLLKLFWKSNSAARGYMFRDWKPQILILAEVLLTSRPSVHVFCFMKIVELSFGDHSCPPGLLTVSPFPVRYVCVKNAYWYVLDRVLSCTSKCQQKCQQWYVNSLQSLELGNVDISVRKKALLGRLAHETKREVQYWPGKKSWSKQPRSWEQNIVYKTIFNFKKSSVVARFILSHLKMSGLPG